MLLAVGLCLAIQAARPDRLATRQTASLRVFKHHNQHTYRRKRADRCLLYKQSTHLQRSKHPALSGPMSRKTSVAVT